MLQFLNVCGLVHRLKYDVFVEKLCKYKIICLSEIKADAVDCITIEKFANDHGYECFCKPRTKVIRKSGGICVLVREDITKYVREVKSDKEIVQWFTLDRTLFGTDKDILLGNIYLPPSNSPYAYSDMFNDLELSLLELNYTNYYCLIAGDFNAHTLNKTDFTDLEEDLAQKIEVVNCKGSFRS